MKEEMRAGIIHISYYLPEQISTNEELAKKYPEINFNDLTKLVGVRKRHHAAKNETASDMAFKAAEKLFMQSGFDRRKVDFLIYCSTQGDYLSPPTSCILQDRLKLKEETGAYDFNHACTGYLYGLSQAKGLIETGQAKNVLLLTSETISKKIHPTDHGSMAIFGDGAAATLIGHSADECLIGNFAFGTDGSKFQQAIIRHGAGRYPYPETKSLDYRDKNGRTRNDGYFYMNGPEFFSFTAVKCPQVIEKALSINLTMKEAVKLFILHQGNRIIVETIFKKLKIRKDQEFYFLENTGNTVQSSIPIALKEAAEQKLIRNGDKIVLAGYGPGLSCAATCIRA